MSVKPRFLNDEWKLGQLAGNNGPPGMNGMVVPCSKPVVTPSFSIKLTCLYVYYKCLNSTLFRVEGKLDLIFRDPTFPRKWSREMLYILALNLLWNEVYSKLQNGMP